MITDLQPNIYFGGDNAAFFGTMAWTIIYGLTFATFLTLIIVPTMYLLADKLMYKIAKWRGDVSLIDMSDHSGDSKEVLA